jgi:hypothetical protein
VLFTSEGDAEYTLWLEAVIRPRFSKVVVFPRMNETDRVELEAIRLHKELNFDSVVGMSEADLLRAAYLREYLGIPGVDSKAMLLFRDKARMKAHAVQAGIPIARYAEVDHVTEVQKFIDDYGYPVILKPLRGRGSAETRMIRDALSLDAYLSEGPFSKSLGLPTLLVEEFITGDIYHVDGWWSGSKPQVLSASRYINTCLDFVGGSVLGSHTLKDENPLRVRLLEFARYVLEKFPTPNNSLFHIEIFVTRDDRLVLCEVACRLGGNGINDEVTLTTGVDIRLEYLAVEFGNGRKSTRVVPLSPSVVAGRLLIPPRPGKLVEFPRDCSHPSVLRYDCRGVADRTYSKMSMSNDEIASFLIRTDSEKEMSNAIQELSAWFDRGCKVSV